MLKGCLNLKITWALFEELFSVSSKIQVSWKSNDDVYSDRNQQYILIVNGHIDLKFIRSRDTVKHVALQHHIPKWQFRTLKKSNFRCRCSFYVELVFMNSEK